MNDLPSRQLMEYRLQQANESLKEAQTLFQYDFLRGAINRAYYAMFYSILALAVLRQEVTSKHSGLIAFFDREFVKPGLFPKELSKSLHLAFQRRQDNDYGDIFTVDKEEAVGAITDAQAFVAAIEQFLRTDQD
jgi:uncharacterized protein (UPF0332 family)